MTAPVAPAIRVDDMRDKLYTLDMVRNRLATTEPLNSHPFNAGKDVRFRLMEGWNDQLEARKPTDLVDAYVTLGPEGAGTEFQLTKEAVLESSAAIGLSKAYVSRSPSHLTQKDLNFWYENGFPGGSEFQLLTTGDTAAALVKKTLTPFSNLQIMDNVLAGIARKYGIGEVLADYKMEHSLTGTTVRLIVPESRRALADTGTADDVWSTGVTFHNSITGDTQTEISGYLFRWYCTNGNTCVHNAGTWSRKSNGQTPEEVYAWAQRSVDDILGGLEGALDDVQATVYEESANWQDFAAMAQMVFDRYGVVSKHRGLILEHLQAGNDPYTMYSLMQAITFIANESGMKPAHVEKLLRIGGDLPHVHSAPCDLGKIHIV